MRFWGPIAAAVMMFLPLAHASSRSQREHGAALFASSGCQHCHTIHTVGGHRGPDLSGVGRRKSKRALREQIVYGSKVMPGFGSALEPQELSDLVTYLRSCRDKSSK
jgi:mono/diheme cytochrome c family protein